jgi:hypothetical protein
MADVFTSVLLDGVAEFILLDEKHTAVGLIDSVLAKIVHLVQGNKRENCNNKVDEWRDHTW